MKKVGWVNRREGRNELIKRKEKLSITYRDVETTRKGTGLISSLSSSVYFCGRKNITVTSRVIFVVFTEIH